MHLRAPILAPRRALFAFFLLLLLLLLPGCAGQFDAPRAAIGAVVTMQKTLQPRLEALRTKAGEACLAGPMEKAASCLSDVRAAWKPTEDAAVALYETIALAELFEAIYEADILAKKQASIDQVMALVGKASTAAAALAKVLIDAATPNAPQKEPVTP